MVRIFMIGIWVIIVSFAALMFGISSRNSPKAKPVELATSAYSYTRTDLFTVPIMVNGDVQGYVMSQLVYAVDRKLSNFVSSNVAYFINDEIYNIIFGSYSTTREVERIKFKDIKKEIIENVNKRFGAHIIEDIFVQQFGYVSQKILNKL